MIGLGPHTMTVFDWTFLAAVQVGLVAAALLALWFAVRDPRSAGGRR